MTKERMIKEISQELELLDDGTVNVLYRIVCKKGKERGSLWKRNIGGRLHRPSKRLTCQS